MNFLNTDFTYFTPMSVGNFFKNEVGIKKVDFGAGVQFLRTKKT